MVFSRKQNSHDGRALDPGHQHKYSCNSPWMTTNRWMPAVACSTSNKRLPYTNTGCLLKMTTLNSTQTSWSHALGLCYTGYEQHFSNTILSVKTAWLCRARKMNIDSIHFNCSELQVLPGTIYTTSACAMQARKTILLEMTEALHMLILRLEHLKYGSQARAGQERQTPEGKVHMHTLKLWTQEWIGWPPLTKSPFMSFQFWRWNMVSYTRRCGSATIHLE